MRYNSQFYGMNYAQRQAKRAENAANRAAAKDKITETIARLIKFVELLEAAYKPLQDQVHAKIVENWMSAFAFCEKHAFNAKAARKAFTGIDFEIPLTLHWSSPEYKAEDQKRTFAWQAWTGSKEYTILHKINDATKQNVHAYAVQRANEWLEDAKFKMREAVGKNLQSYQKIGKVVEIHSSAHYEKGFHGEFRLETDKGPVLFDCKVISAQGPVQSFHYRYICHVKSL